MPRLSFTALREEGTDDGEKKGLSFFSLRGKESFRKTFLP